MSGGRDPREVAGWTVAHLACLGSARPPGAPAVLESMAALGSALAEIEAEERRWYEPAARPAGDLT